jgi:hypothetical protein
VAISIIVSIVESSLILVTFPFPLVGIDLVGVGLVGIMGLIGIVLLFLRGVSLVRILVSSLLSLTLGRFGGYL